MKGVMFNTKYGLEQAVLNKTKTRTWRADKQPRYEVGEVVAIKQCYCRVYGENKEFLESKVSKDVLINKIFTSAGWRNKMFIQNALMPHQIRITAIKKCRLQEILPHECIKEGIMRREDSLGGYTFQDCKNNYYGSPIIAFANLINKLNGKGYWSTNPKGYAYEFELIK